MTSTQAKMAAQVAELCSLDTFPSALSPADVLLSTDHLESVLGHGGDPPTVLFTPQRPQGTGQLALLVRVHPIAGGEKGESGSEMRLFASHRFMRHHSLGSRVKGTVRPMEPMSLDRVVLGASCHRGLRWTTAEPFPARLLELCGPGRWLLARQGEPLLLPGEEPAQVSPGGFLGVCQDEGRLFGKAIGGSTAVSRAESYWSV